MQREILSQVASGEISASEGASRLEALGDVPPPSPDRQAPVAATLEAAGTTKNVRVTSRFGSAEIIGDPTVAFVVADGPHSARQDGDTMVIDHSPLSEDSNFTFISGRRALVNGFGISDRPLTVRMNPDLALFAKMQAGAVRIEGVHGPITGEVQAGSCTVRDFRSPLDLLVLGGELDATGRLDSGASKLRCRMGEMKVRLQRGSSVRITARSTMGDITIDGPGVASLVRGSSGEVTVGGGAGTLEAECTMGNIKLIPE